MDAPFPAGMVEAIAAFLETDAQRPQDQDLYPEVFDTSLFFPLQRQQELAAMIRLARSIKPKVIMEIGADKGGGLYHWCKGLKTTLEQVIAYEVRGTPYHMKFERAFEGSSFFWGKSSQDKSRFGELREYLDARSNRIDVLFIDGDKTLMEQDFDLYLPLMNPQGIVFFHDIQDREPRASYWNVRARGYGGKVIVNLEDTQAALARMHGGIPPATPHEAWLRHWRGRSCGVGVVNLGERDEIMNPRSGNEPQP